MKILPVIICGGAGTRLFAERKNNLPKQFVDFGNWTMFQKTLDRINSKIYLPPIISTNIKYSPKNKAEMNANFVSKNNKLVHKAIPPKRERYKVYLNNLSLFS